MTIDPAEAIAFLSHGRLAVIGASDRSDNFGTAVYRELRKRGRDVVAVNPHVAMVLGDRCYPDLASVPGDLDGAIVMVRKDQASNVVAQCIERGVPRVWLFKGFGGVGAVSDEAVEQCERNGIDVVAGACPFMFLEPVDGLHRFHRALRRLNGSVGVAA